MVALWELEVCEPDIWEPEGEYVRCPTQHVWCGAKYVQHEQLIWDRGGSGEVVVSTLKV